MFFLTQKRDIFLTGFLACTLAVVLGLPMPGHGQNFTVLHTFSGSDGANPTER